MPLLRALALLCLCSPALGQSPWTPRPAPHPHPTRYNFDQPGYFDHWGASTFHRPGPSRNPQAAMDAARARLGYGPVQRDSRLDRLASRALAVLGTTGQVHTLYTDDVRGVGWPLDGPEVPNANPLWRRHNWSEVVGAYGDGGFNPTLDGLIQGVETHSAGTRMEPHAEHFNHPWTHWGYAEGPNGMSGCLWMGYLVPGRPEPPILPDTSYRWKTFSGASDYLHPGPSADWLRATNEARRAAGCPPFRFSPKLCIAAEYALARTPFDGHAYYAHGDIDAAVRASGWPIFKGVPWSAWGGLNYTESFGCGRLGDALNMMLQDTEERGHGADFRKPWTHVGFSQGPHGVPCTIFYGYLP